MIIPIVPSKYKSDRTLLLAQLAETLVRVRTVRSELECVLALLAEGGKTDCEAAARLHHERSKWRQSRIGIGKVLPVRGSESKSQPRSS